MLQFWLGFAVGMIVGTLGGILTAIVSMAAEDAERKIDTWEEHDERN